MKSLKLLTICGATLMLVACTKDDVTTTASFEELKATQPTPVAFSTYLGESATTRAAIDTDEALQNAGFGVFAYLTAAPYANTSNEAATPAVVNPVAAATTPNFMYNQKVYGSSWGYSPIKYWPNDFNGDNGAVDSRTGSDTPASGSTTNYLSFFAYAPYVATVSNTTGITGISANNAPGDPKVTYKLNPSADNVDLLWGTYSGTSENVLSAVQSGGYVMYDSNSDESVDKIGNAKVNINLTKQKTGGSVGFAFKPALAKIGAITVDAIVDEVTQSNGSVDTKTIITVESVTITSTDDMANTATLNLATGVWDVDTSTATAPLTLNFGGLTGITLNTSIAEPESISTSDLEDTNEDGKLDSWISGTPTVTTSSVNLASSLPLLTFFPGTSSSFNVNIVYRVRTADPELNANFTNVQQNITKTIQFGSAFAMNTQYNLAIHLGLTSVKFTASVSEWDSSSAAVDLPINVATPPSSGD